ncbi:cyclin G isoform X2 [Arctopsyche grandis]
MQRQPEPSDGKPKVPDASSRKYSPHHSKRGKTRFRDDKSRKHYHGTNSNRHNVKKYDNSLNRCDSFSIRKDTPPKSFPNFNHQNKKDKIKNPAGRIDGIENSPATLSNNDHKNPLCKSLPLIDGTVDNRDLNAVKSRKNLFIEPSMLLEVNNENSGNALQKSAAIPTDEDMKLIDDNSDEMKLIDNLKDQSDSSELTESTDSFELENSVEELNATFKEYLQVESKFQPRLYLPVLPQRGEIGAGTRDGAVHVLRCLKVWYDLPTDVLFHAINLLDRFLTKMKVRLCHISCISVSCMHIAILSHRPKLPSINTDDLVSISQCKCTAGDVGRMSAIIEQKLGAVGETVSPLHWLRLLLKLLRWAAVNLFGIPSHFILNLLQETEIINRLEILSCDASCCNVRACELALVLICTQLDSQLNLMQRSGHTSEQINNLMRIVEFAMELQKACQISDSSFYATHQAVICILERYNTRQKTPHRQCLVWRLSSRTLKVLRPTDKLTSMLPTIQEQQFSAGSPLKTAAITRPRSGSESSEDLNEDTKDWPTSPVVPVLCNNN